MNFTEFEKILPVPAGVEKKLEWGPVEQELQLALPSDYKKFVEKYGEGWVGNFIMILDPFSANDRYNLIKASSQILTNYKSSKDAFPQYYRHNVFYDGNGLFPCGITENADVIYWEYAEGVPEKIVVYSARGGDYYSIESTLIGFLAGILRKKIICEKFPSDFPSDNVEFVLD